MNTSKANGPDNISNLVLKTCAETLSPSIEYLINKSLKDGSFPIIWKEANVVPIYKKDDRRDIKNYRPVSLLSCTSKVMERLVYNRLYEYCCQFNLLTPRNSGFKRRDGSVNRLLYLVENIYRGLDNEQEIAVVLLDITRAFDRVWHKGLLFKLRNIGISGSLLQWFESYLTSRYQKVVIKGKSSELKRLLAGVPQGSILGPLLFLIFINDLGEDFVSDLNMFADDTALLQEYSVKAQAENILNNDLKEISKWGQQWMVDFNPQKTVFLNFSLKKKKTKLNLSFDNTPIKQVTEQKYLGLILSDDLKWTKHIRFVCSKASKLIGLLYRNSMYFNVNQMSNFYKVAIRPILEYASVVFDGCSMSDSLLIESVQRRAANVCTGAMKRTESVKVMADLEWETLKQRRINCKLKLFYKIKNGLVSSGYLQNLIPSVVNLNRDNARYSTVCSDRFPSNLRRISEDSPTEKRSAFQHSDGERSERRRSSDGERSERRRNSDGARNIHNF